MYRMFRRYALFFSLALVLALAGIIWWISSGGNPKPDTIISQVGEHIVLPVNETPTLASVEDQSKLQSSLKKMADTGDQLLIYEKAGYIIVYRPSIDKVVSVQPLLFGKQGNPNLNVTVGIQNGSGSEEVLSKFISRLYEAYPNIRLISKSDTPRQFPATIIFGSEQGDSLASQIGEGLGIKAGQAPQGIGRGSEAVTIIVGTDYK